MYRYVCKGGEYEKADPGNIDKAGKCHGTNIVFNSFVDSIAGRSRLRGTGGIHLYQLGWQDIQRQGFTGHPFGNQHWVALVR